MSKRRCVGTPERPAWEYERTDDGSIHRVQSAPGKHGCLQLVEVTMVNAEGTMWRKSADVVICPHCDRAVVD